MDDNYAHRQLTDSGMFIAREPQGNGSVCYTLDGHRAASIYVHKSGDIHIRYKTLERNRFPEPANAIMWDYIRDHHYETTREEHDPSYKLYAEHIDAIIEIISL